MFAATVPEVKVTTEEARRFLVARQLLAPARSLEGGPDAVLQVFRRLPRLHRVPRCGRGAAARPPPPHPPGVARRGVADYEPAWCDELYERREIFEAYSKG